MCRSALVGSINDWCAMTTSLGVVLKRWRFTCSWSRWPMRRGLSYYSDKTAGRLLSLNEAQLREARCTLMAAGLVDTWIDRCWKSSVTTLTKPRRQVFWTRLAAHSRRSSPSNTNWHCCGVRGVSNRRQSWDTVWANTLALALPEC
jgi:hypothetical protein